MRHVAWLNTAPRDKDGKAAKTRLEAIKEGGDRASYPPLTLCPYMVEHLFDAGPAMSGGMGSAPLSHSEISAWQANTGMALSPWEARMLRRLSGVYVAESQDAEAPDCPAPWTLEIQEEVREDVSKKVQNAFRLLMSTRPKQ